MEEKRKMKSTVASIPANYVSIIQLQERWMREKEKKGELVEREVKQQVHGQRRRQEETMEQSVKLEEKGLRAGFNKPSGVNRGKKEPTCVKKEEVEKVSVIVSKKEEKGLRVGLTKPSGVNRLKKEPTCVKKEEVEQVSVTVSKKEENEREGDLSEKKKKKKKKVKEIVKCESKFSQAHVPRKEDKNNPVKEIVVVAKDSTAVEEVQFQELRIKKRVEEEEEGREVKVPVRLSNGQGYVGNNQRRVTRTTTRAMVWVKKGENDGSACGNGF